MYPLGSSERNSPVDDTVELELDQLRQERELLREEVAQVSARLKATRDDLQETERRLESGREQASQSLQLLQDNLQEERKKRQAAEEDCRSHSEVGFIFIWLLVLCEPHGKDNTDVWISQKYE